MTEHRVFAKIQIAKEPILSARKSETLNFMLKLRKRSIDAPLPSFLYNYCKFEPYKFYGDKEEITRAMRESEKASK